ncbi:MAG: tripartite tricarboxylate transporter substrate binding protein [Betaproteobacteria bacterium]|nr:tripartite tricarboxylate transporter substrate binding protein [Betaproteobacteria bacterium]
MHHELLQRIPSRLVSTFARTFGARVRCGSARVLCGGALALCIVSAAMAQDAFPSKPVRLFIFGAAGGPLDILARAFADKLVPKWGQPIIIDAKPGAGGIIVADYVAKQPGDGYTLLMTLPLTHVNNPILFVKLPYDPVRDFEPVTQLGTGGPVLIAPANVPYNTLKEFIVWAKARPRVTYGSWGIGSGAHLFGETLKRNAGLPLDHVPYKNEAPMHLDMLGGQLDMGWANPGTARRLVAGSKIKILAIAGVSRIGVLPDVPTFADAGLKGFDLDAWVGIYASKGTPKAIVEKISADFRETMKAPDLRTRMLDMGFEPLGNTPEEFAANYARDFPKWVEVIRSAGVTAQ